MQDELEREQHKLINKNKARIAIGLRPIILKLGKCLRCNKEILINKSYRCNDCNYFIGEKNFEEEVFERQSIFVCRDNRYITTKRHYIMGGMIERN